MILSELFFSEKELVKTAWLKILLLISNYVYSIIKDIVFVINFNEFARISKFRFNFKQEHLFPIYKKFKIAPKQLVTICKKKKSREEINGCVRKVLESGLFAIAWQFIFKSLLILRQCAAYLSVSELRVRRRTFISQLLYFLYPWMRTSFSPVALTSRFWNSFKIYF